MSPRAVGFIFSIYAFVNFAVSPSMGKALQRGCALPSTKTGPFHTCTAPTWAEGNWLTRHFTALQHMVQAGSAPDACATGCGTRAIRRKTLLLIGQIICALSAAAFGLVTLLHEPSAFTAACLALRVVNGLGSAAVDTSSFAIISE